MGVRLGITRSLLFYSYYPLWASFFRSLGAEVILSPPTTREILERGVRLGVADLCLPMKLHLGHVERLRGKVDFLFLPRLVSFSADTYLCPKFLGLPDFVKAAIEGLPPLLSPCFNAKVANKGIWEGLREAGRMLGEGEGRIEAAFGEAQQIQLRFEKLLHKGVPPLIAMEAVLGKRGEEGREGRAPQEARPCIGVVGHPYNLYDDYLNFNLLHQVRGWGYDLLTPEVLLQEEVEEGNALLRKKVYWSLTRRIVGAALTFLSSGRIQGMIFLSSFGCGPDSFSKDLVDRRAKAHSPLPYLSLVLDEHTSQTGLQTRLDAFLDMVRARTNRRGEH
ncbi:MAG: acyl-CoA dehydratase activase-related protein [candidate division NC10 bacterium]|nr:acyl-CoA dehydratase activase-related protein [candidate division NC10 bacterium]